MNVLVVAAHPDDEVLGCGATIARHADRGDAVHVLILGEGITSRHDQPSDADPEELRALHRAAARASDVLGAKDCELTSLPDNRFDTVALLDVVKIVERAVATWQPEIVYTHHGGDLNVDHAITFRAVLTATRPTPGCFVRSLLAFEVPSSTEWAFGRLEPRFAPDTYVDVGATLERKIAALREYDGELRAFPHPRSAEGLDVVARRWGSVVGVDAAEAFETIRAVIA